MSKYIEIPENVREWINGLLGDDHTKENTFTNKERWLLGQSASEMWEYIETNPYRLCPLKDNCPFKREHCLSDRVGYECRRIFIQWASRPISKHDGSRYTRDMANYQTKLEIHELRQTLTGQSAAIEVIQRQLADLTKVLTVPAEPLPVADVTNLPLSELKLPTKTYNSLWKAGLSTIQDLFELRSIHDLRAIHNLGKIGQAAVIRRMYENGFTSWADRMSKRPYRRADKV